MTTPRYPWTQRNGLVTLVATFAWTTSEVAMRLGRRLSSGIAEDPPAATSVPAPPETPAETPAPVVEVRVAETREHASAHVAEH